MRKPPLSRLLLKQLTQAFDSFLDSGMDTHVTNPAWKELCDDFQYIKIHLKRYPVKEEETNDKKS